MTTTCLDRTQQLISGQFVTVILEYESPVEKIVIPQASLMRIDDGQPVSIVHRQSRNGAFRIVDIQVRFDGGIVRILRGDMLERCHTVHPELSRR